MPMQHDLAACLATAAAVGSMTWQLLLLLLLLLWQLRHALPASFYTAAHYGACMLTTGPDPAPARSCCAPRAPVIWPWEVWGV